MWLCLVVFSDFDMLLCLSGILSLVLSKFRDLIFGLHAGTSMWLCLVVYSKFDMLLCLSRILSLVLSNLETLLFGLHAGTSMWLCLVVYSILICCCAYPEFCLTIYLCDCISVVSPALVMSIVFFNLFVYF